MSYNCLHRINCCLYLDKAGPCADAEDPMACLHGMLMHGDDHEGETHKAEDQYLRFQPVLRTGSPDKAGPQDAEQAYHASIMHNGEDPTHAHQADVTEPRTSKQLGPDEADTALHGVLMHGDDQQGHAHEGEDKQLRSAKVKDGQRAAPMDAEQLMHGVLMHGDSSVENHHVHDNPNSNKGNTGVPGPVDLEQKMHKMMHKDGDLDHTDTRDGQKSGTVPGPNDQEDIIHQLMHNGEQFIHNILENNQPFKFNVAEIMRLGIDPDILRSVGLDKIRIEDEEDYQSWQKKQNTDTLQGETNILISDSIIPDIELMKRRYMNLGSETEQEIQQYADSRNIEIIPEELLANLELINGAGDHTDDDIEHDLELIGSTDPINARHKVHMSKGK